MKFNELMAQARTYADINSPSILMGAGIVAIVGGTVMACKATLKAKDTIDKHNEDMENLKKKEKEKEEAGEKYNRSHDAAAVYKRTCCQIAICYAPAVISLGFGIGCVIESNHILNDRSTAAAAAAATATAAFKQYRDRVIDELGEEADERFKTGRKEQEIEEETVDTKGRKHKEKKKVFVDDPSSVGTGYRKYFTQSNPYWNDDDLMMEAFFNMEQNYANNIFHINKKYTLIEVYRRLGFLENEMDPDSMVMGWIEGCGDQYIDFNVAKVMLPDGDGKLKKAYALDFNVQCNVYNTIKKRKNAALKEAA